MKGTLIETISNLAEGSLNLSQVCLGSEAGSPGAGETTSAWACPTPAETPSPERVRMGSGLRVGLQVRNEGIKHLVGVITLCGQFDGLAVLGAKPHHRQN